MNRRGFIAAIAAALEIDRDLPVDPPKARLRTAPHSALPLPEPNIRLWYASMEDGNVFYRSTPKIGTTINVHRPARFRVSDAE